MVIRYSDGREVRRYIGPQDVADIVGVPLKTIYQWSSNRTGPKAYKLGRHLRYREDEVIEWIDSRAVPSGPAA